MSNEVISTRVRLARNLKDYPFPCRLSEQGRKRLLKGYKCNQGQQQLNCLGFQSD